MADRNNRTVRLNVEAGVTGQEEIADLGKSLQGVGDAAKGSAPDISQMTREVEALSAATKQQREAERQARTDAAAAKREFDALREARALLRAEADRSTKGTAEYEARERALTVAIVKGQAALREKQDAVRTAAAATREAVAAEQALTTQIERAGQAAIRSATQQAAAARQAAGPVDALKDQWAAVQRIAALALGGSLIGGAVREVGEVADAYSGLAARVKLATGEGAAFDSTFRGIGEVAQRTGTAIESVGALVTKLVSSGKDIGVTNQQALQLAETITQSLALSGATVQEQASATQQLGQALASGKLQGDELKSILESGPRLAKALADGLGTTVGALKDLGSTGALTSQQIVSALLGQSQALQKEFDALPLTVGRAVTNLKNSFVEYIGEADKASGASRTAAEAIQLVARNLDLLVGALLAAGKTAAAYAALNLAKSFIDGATAARAAATATTAATAATVAHTAATTANTAAQGANAAASAGSVAAVGRLAGILSTIKTLSLIGILTNLREIGTAVGEGAAKLLGYGKAEEELDRQNKALEASSRAQAAAVAAAAQAAQQATDRALGLDKQSKALVATFDGLTNKGESTADALRKVAKELDLSDVRGIAIAGTALDALALRGKITGEALREALGAALKGEDLARFETQARAAFDGSEQGVRRLKAALDALAEESLRRAGTSAKELGTGFSDAATSAINDVDALARTLQTIKAPADEASRALATALDKALAAANTERAVRAVIDRLTDLGKAGVLAGDALATGLGKAQQKLDELKPGVNSLAEAMRALGLKTREELNTTAERLGEAYKRVASSGQVSLAQQIEAYNKWRDAALAASGGVETEQLKLQRIILEGKAAAAGFGDSLVDAMDRGKSATEAAAKAAAKYRDLLRADPDRLVSGDGLAGFGGSGSNSSTPSGGAAAGSSAGGPTTGTAGPFTRTAAGQLTPPDASGDWEFVNDASNAAFGRAASTNLVVAGVGYWRRKSTGGGMTLGGVSASGTVGGLSPGGFPRPTPAPTPGAPAAAVQRFEVLVRMPDGPRTIYTATADDAAKLIAAIGDLAKLSGGG